MFLVFRPGMDLLPLFVEALALLPASRRWEVDFSTYFNQLPQGVTCAWRGVLEGSDEAKNARRLPNALVLDLCQPLGRAEGGALVHLARTGERLVQEPAVATTACRRAAGIFRECRQSQWLRHAGLRPTGASRPRTATGSYELIPEFAELVPGARLPSRYREYRLSRPRKRPLGASRTCRRQRA